MTDLLTIGELARLSGLSASALRFYDRQGVLVPAEVDAVSGYRRYAPGQVSDARVVAHLRRVGMPLGELSLVLDLRARGQVTDARDVVVAHETRLEEGLQQARREIARALEALETAGRATATVTVAGPALGAALGAVRFAVWESPDEPFGVLAGVLVEVAPDGLRLVATDRYRLGVGRTAARTEGGAVGLNRGWVLPPRWLEEVVQLAAGGDVRLELDDDVCRARSGERLIQSPCVAGEFPDYRRFLDVEEVRNHAGADASSLARSELLTGGAGTPVGLAVGDGSVRVAGPDDEPVVHVNGEFLLEALSGLEGVPSLVLDGPISPLVIRGANGGLSVLMPVSAP